MQHALIGTAVVTNHFDVRRTARVVKVEGNVAWYRYDDGQHVLGTVLVTCIDRIALTPAWSASRH